jgi:peptidyl-tRNA hydrolase, PTH1 family
LGDTSDYLIVGLGNPGVKYEKTRHNLGFIVVEGLAKKHGLSLKRMWRLSGKVASGEIEGRRVYLLLPTTYMNLSGNAVRKALQYYKLPIDHLLVIVDDVYLKFGDLRLRPQGSAGGHNGLKHIEACLGTQAYARLRMGVGSQDGEGPPNGREMALEEYVLANFTPDEQSLLPRVVEEGVSAVEAWIR